MKNWALWAASSLVCTGVSQAAHADNVSEVVRKVVRIAAQPKVERGVAVESAHHHGQRRAG